ncbi:putative mutase [Citrobacter freundii]|nr:putative mutase [Citrobacter freundii]
MIVLVVMADHGNDPTIGHSHHTREVVPVLVYQQGLAPARLGVSHHVI